MTHLKFWLEKNQLILNEKKTQKKVFTLSNKQGKQECVKFLGLYLDTKLNWKGHIEKLSKQLSKVLYLMRRLRKEVNSELMKTTYYGLFHSRMAYGIEIWGSTSDALIVFRLQKKAIRIIMEKNRYDSCKEMFKSLNIMTLTSLFIYKNALKQKVTQHQDVRSNQYSYNIRSKSNLNLPFTRLIKSEMAPSCMSRKIYNKIPEKIRVLSDRKFKKVLNKFLIINSFYSLNEFMCVNWTVADFNID